jgi:hypothetical protein
MPGPTWPNRYFLHAASSGGLDDSLACPSEVLTETVDGYEFENGTIFHRLEAHSRKWIVFERDEFPQVKSIAGLDETYFHDFAHFRKYVDDPELAASYIFIEPNYGHDLLPSLSPVTHFCTIWSTASVMIRTLKADYIGCTPCTAVS